MAIQILNNCAFDSTKIKTLWIGSRLSNGNAITYPIQYTTITGTTDSMVKIEDWDYINNYVTIGGQIIVVNQIANMGDNISFNEDLVIDNNGKTYRKTINFTIPNLTTFLINQLKEFTITSSGLAQLAPTIAMLVDDNDQTLIVGYDKPLYLQTTDFQIGESNQVSLSYTSSSYSRARAYYAYQAIPVDVTKIWTGATSYWRLNETSGTAVVDAKAAVSNGVKVTGSFNAGGKRGYCYYNGGFSTGLEFGNNYNYERTDSWSANLWVKPTVLTSGSLIGKYNSTSGIGWLFSYGVSGDLKVELRNAGNYINASQTSGISLASVNHWYMVTMTYDGSSLGSGIKMYVNSFLAGQSTTVNTLAVSIVTANTIKFRIGGIEIYNTARVVGYIDEVSMWSNHILSQEEILVLYNNGTGIFY